MSSHAPHLLTLDLPGALPATARQRTPLGFALGKYREIVIAVAFFLLFDLAVLVLNFYVSFQIGEDAVAINLAGRERMLTQRLSKVLFSWELAVTTSGEVPADLVKELQTAAQLQLFGQSQLLTAGGPSGASRTAVLFLFETAFGRWELGYASAAAEVLFLLILAVTISQYWLTGRATGAQGGR